MIRSRHQFSRICLAVTGLGLAVTGSAVQAEDILDFDPAVNLRFSSGYSNVQLTSPPVANTDPSFVAAGYDLSAIGWNTASDPNGTPANQQSVTLISPMFYAAANHHSVTPSNGGLLTFMGSDGNLYHTSTASRLRLVGDGQLGQLAAPLPSSAQVSYYSILDLGNSGADYLGQSLLVYGWYGVIGEASVTSSWWSSSYGSQSFGDVGVRSGDSGSPSLIPYEGQLTLAGTRSSTNSYTEFKGGGDEVWYNPYLIRAANAAMAPYGYAVRVIAVPTKTWSGASSGDFSTASNWIEGAAPDREGIAFDAGSANGQYAINLAGAGSIKGITFTPAGGDGFVFAAGSTLQLGTGGIINNSPQTQTFNNDFVMAFQIDASTTTGGQHWSANGGNLVVNGAVANNGFQLVVEGAKQTTLNGVLSGTGGLGKEGTGKLILTAANTYSGKTFVTDGILAVNNTSGSGTGTGTVTLNGGTLAGNGTIGAVVIAKSGATLSPGNADVDQRGILTINSSVGLAAGAHLAIHIDGLGAGVGYDQLLVTNGLINLNGATLDLTVGEFDAEAGDQFWILNNSGAGLLVNQFAGLGQEALVGSVNGLPMHIYYNADSGGGSLTGGNDVVITVVPEPALAGLLCPVGLLLARRRNK